MNLGRLLERAGALETIAYLSNHGEATKTELIHEVGVCRQSVCRTIEELVRAGVIDVKEEGRFPGRKFHTLTPKGYELARTPLGSLDATLRKWK